MDRPEHKTHDKTWTEDRAFDGNGIRVQVNKLPLSRRPHYSLAVGRIAPDGGMMKFMPVMANGSGEQIDVTPIGSQLSALVQQAEAYIRAEIQNAERAWLAEMGDAPPRDSGPSDRRRNFGPDRVARAGKTARDHEQRGRRGREG